MHDLLAGYPVVIEISIAWGEMDAFQHVNNIVYLRYAESARIAYLERAGLGDTVQLTGVGPILHSLQCRYKFPLTYPDTARVGVRVSEVGVDRFTVLFRILSARHQRVAAEGESIIVSYDYGAGSKVPLPKSWRAAMEALEPALQLRSEAGAAF
jgi:acyl-CoA thioester hydrolase